MKQQESPERLLFELLRQSFSLDELVRFAQFTYPHLGQAMLSSGSHDSITFNLVNLLKAHGEINEDFFLHLLQDRPRKRSEIVTCALRWGIPCGLQAEASRTELTFEAFLAAKSHRQAARHLMNKGDGRAALVELDRADQLDPLDLSTDPHSEIAPLRGQCLLLAGECEKGKELYTQIFRATTNYGQRWIDRTIEHLISVHGRGDISPREQLLQAHLKLSLIASDVGPSISVSECVELCKAIQRLRPQVLPQDEEDHVVIQARRDSYYIFAQALAQLGACDLAWDFFVQDFPPDRYKYITDQDTVLELIQQSFRAMIGNKCKDFSHRGLETPEVSAKPGKRRSSIISKGRGSKAR